MPFGIVDLKRANDGFEEQPSIENGDDVFVACRTVAVFYADHCIWTQRVVTSIKTNVASEIRRSVSLIRKFSEVEPAARKHLDLVKQLLKKVEQFELPESESTEPEKQLPPEAVRGLQPAVSTRL